MTLDEFFVVLRKRLERGDLSMLDADCIRLMDKDGRCYCPVSSLSDDAPQDWDLVSEKMAIEKGYAVAMASDHPCCVSDSCWALRVGLLRLIDETIGLPESQQ